mmetsp:Transcript_124545/g.360127  ORF Transcript_124545/g.360127 Transcript_124545/m.360127 type:complete len:342 (-) Transcript_124545:1666-2691(-)
MHWGAELAQQPRQLLLHMHAIGVTGRTFLERNVDRLQLGLREPACLPPATGRNLSALVDALHEVVEGLAETVGKTVHLLHCGLEVELAGALQLGQLGLHLYFRVAEDVSRVEGLPETPQLPLAKPPHEAQEVLAVEARAAQHALRAADIYDGLDLDMIAEPSQNAQQVKDIDRVVIGKSVECLHDVRVLAIGEAPPRLAREGRGDEGVEVQVVRVAVLFAGLGPELSQHRFEGGVAVRGHHVAELVKADAGAVVCVRSLENGPQTRPLASPDPPRPNKKLPEADIRLRVLLRIEIRIGENGRKSLLNQLTSLRARSLDQQLPQRTDRRGSAVAGSLREDTG